MDATIQSGQLPRRTDSARTLLGVCALLFAASAAVTAAWCGSMAGMGGMAMPGGWTMSMAWMRMPGQTWSGAAASFIGMWAVMMVAMMLPCLVPMLLRYSGAVCGAERLGLRMVFVGAGYFCVWTLFGVVIFPAGVALAALEMQMPALSRAVPVAGGVIVLAAGALQFSKWKARQLACCRAMPACRMPADAAAAWRHGMRLGLHCGYCCAGFTAILLVLGVMNLGAMALVAAAMAVERLAPGGARMARVIGLAAIAGGMLMIARTLA